MSPGSISRRHDDPISRKLAHARINEEWSRSDDPLLLHLEIIEQAVHLQFLEVELEAKLDDAG